MAPRAAPVADPPPDEDRTPFTLDVLVAGTQALVRPLGDLDVLSARKVRERLRQLLRDCTTVTVDLSGVPHADASGVEVLEEIGRRAAMGGATVSFVDPTPWMGRLLRLTGAHGRLALGLGASVRPSDVRTPADSRPAPANGALASARPVVEDEPHDFAPLGDRVHTPAVG